MKFFITLLSILHCILLFAQQGGVRTYTGAEKTRWTSICTQLSEATAPSFKDYTVTKTACGTFQHFEKDFSKDPNGIPMTVINLENEPIGRKPYFDIYYRMTDAEISKRQKVIDAGLADTKSKDSSAIRAQLQFISAQNKKLDQCKTIHVLLSTNRASNLPLVNDFEKSAIPEKLNIDATFAYVYTSGITPDAVERTAAKQSGYLDKALIIFSGTLPRIENMPAGEPGKELQQKIYLQDDAPETSLTAIKNIVVEIYGCKPDIEILIKQMNWKQLKSMIGK